MVSSSSPDKGTSILASTWPTFRPKLGDGGTCPELHFGGRGSSRGSTTNQVELSSTLGIIVRKALSALARVKQVY